MYLLSLILILTLSLNLFNCGPTLGPNVQIEKNDLYPLAIIHINDFHAR